MMSREVAALLLDDAGFEATSFESGEAALSALESNHAIPAAMLIDMQMPGLTGDTLALKLRAACGPSTRLIAMSGTAVPEARRRHFDTFLPKPFSVEEILHLLGGTHKPEPTTAPPAEPAAIDPTMLNLTTFTALRQDHTAHAAPRALQDVPGRCRRPPADHAAGQRGPGLRNVSVPPPHSIKGGCGMVGAIELAKIAADFEQQGMPAVHNMVPFQQFLAASARLRGMLGRVLDNAD